MQYKVEEPAQLKKQIEVTVPAAEVDAQIQVVAGRYRASAAVPGFRKGKAPLNRVLALYAKDVYSEATESIVNDYFDKIVEELKLEPASRANFNVHSMTRGQDFTFTFSLDVMPEFELPAYAGTPVQEEEVEITDEEINNVIEMARRDMARLVPVEEKRTPRDGDVVNLDVNGFDAEGNEVAGLKVSGMGMVLGEKQIFEAFEDFIKTIPVGEENEKKILFPEGFVNPELSGKEYLIKIKVNAINVRELPEINDEFAGKLGSYDSVQAVKDVVRKSFQTSRESMARSAAQSRLLASLLEKVEFPLPQSLVDHFTQVAQANSFESLQRQGVDLSDATVREQTRELARRDAEKHVREYVFLYRVAQAEGIEVSENEITQYLQQVAASSRRPFAEVRDEYINNNMLGVVHDRIMSDKALSAIFAKAEVEKVKAGSLDNAADESGETEKAKTKAKKAPAKARAKKAEAEAAPEDSAE